MKIEQLRKAGEILGREGLSKEVIKHVEEFDGSYKGAMKLAGQLSVIAKMATFDGYWTEKTLSGITDAECHAQQLLEGK